MRAWSLLNEGIGPRDQASWGKSAWSLVFFGVQCGLQFVILVIVPGETLVHIGRLGGLARTVFEQLRSERFDNHLVGSCGSVCSLCSCFGSAAGSVQQPVQFGSLFGLATGSVRQLVGFAIRFGSAAGSVRFGARFDWFCNWFGPVHTCFDCSRES